MSEDRISIHTQTKGSLGQDEDWWTLLVNKVTGAKSVEHGWSYTDAYKGGGTNSGKTVTPADEFIASASNSTVIDKLRALLAGKG